MRTAVTALSGAVALVLLISLANAAGLFLIQGSARTRELAVRAALGAERSRLVGQISIENAMLAVAAAVAGTLLAFAAVGMLVRGAPADLPRLSEVTVDRGALAFALLAAVIATVGFGLIPTLWITRSTPFHSLRGSQRGATGSSANRRLQEALIVGQVAVAVVLFSGAGLLVRSLSNLRGVDLGVDQSGLALVNVPRTTPTRADLPATIAFYGRLSERLAAAPGIRAVTATTTLPFAGPNAYSTFYALPGQTAAQAGRNSSVDLEAAAPNFFATLAIPIVRGRPFSTSDRAGPPSVIVNAAFAREAWRGRNPIGERLKFGGAESPSMWYSVVGVAADSRYRNLTRDVPTVYLPLERLDSLMGLPPSVLAVRSTLAPGAVLGLVRSIAHQLDPSVETLGVETIPDALAAPLARPRFSTGLLTTFALIAILLTTIGLFGVMASFVQERTREIGIRIAVGAQTAQIRRLVLGRGLRLTALGMGIGLAFALGITRLLASLLYELRPSDPLTYLTVAAGMMAVTALACYWPVRRAARIDPMTVLTSD
ncbi:MAG: FtsX-like permease family protein [Gemmatimonadota bacterium]